MNWYEHAITIDRNWQQFKAEELLYQKREGKADKGKEKETAGKPFKLAQKPFQTWFQKPQY